MISTIDIDKPFTTDDKVENAADSLLKSQRQIISNFDQKRKKVEAKHKKSHFDFIKLNSIRTLQKRDAIEAIVNQNYSLLCE